MTLSAKSAFFVLFKAGLIDYCKKQKINEVEPISFNQLTTGSLTGSLLS